MEEASESNCSSADESDSPESPLPPVSATEEEDETTAQEQPSKEKKARKPRKRNELTNETFKITRIDDRGYPVSPQKNAKGFSNAVGCIARETVKITCMDLRAKKHENLRQILFNRLFNRYTFEDDEMQEQVRDRALCIATKALNTFRNTVSKLKTEDFETVVKKKYPEIDEEDWKQFVSCHSNDDFAQKSSQGKEMREKNKMDHKLGTRGYVGKRPKWDKEDAARIAAGKKSPFSNIEPGHGRDFLRARASYDPVTGEPVFKSAKLMEVHEKLSQPQTQNSQDYADCERWQDPLSIALGGVEHRGRVRGVGYGASWKIYFPQNKEVARLRRRARSAADFDRRLEAMVNRILEERGIQPMHQNTQASPSPSFAAHTPSPNNGGPSSSASATSVAPGSANPIDDITDLTPCHLLAPMMDGVMVTVAHGRVHSKTKDNKLHCVDLPPDMARVEVNKVLDSFVGLDVNGRHPEPDCNTLGQCKGYVMKWPKAAIKLVKTSTRPTPRCSNTPTTPADNVIRAPLTFEDLAAGQVEEDVDMDQEDQGIGSNSSVAPKHGAAKTTISPNTLNGAAVEAIRRGKSPAPQHARTKKMKEKVGKKEQKLKKSLSYESTTAKGERESGKWRTYHIPHEPLVPKDEFKLLPVEMKILHENIRQLESQEGNASHFTAKVPADYNFVTDYPADKFYLEFPEIFRMFNLGMLESSLVRLWALYQVRETRRNKALSNVAVIDPYHMHEHNLSSDEGREIIKDCIVAAMLEHKAKKYILLPYHPENHWILIILVPKDRKAFYLDSLKKQVKGNFRSLSKVLDDALFDYNCKGGSYARKGPARFRHYTEFSCTQQPNGSVTCGYYVCCHMDVFVRSQNTLHKSEDIELLGNQLESNPFDWREEFPRIQNIFAKIINTDVWLDSGLFYSGCDTLEEHDARTRIMMRKGL